MDYIQVTFHPVALYQLAAFPCAILYSYLCSFGHLPITPRYMYLLAGGLILACASMGPYAILLFIPAFGSIVLFHTVSWQSVHRWAFLLQMAWQTGCHLWLLYKEYYVQETISIRLSIMISSLMLLTQRVTSLALDIHERKVKIIPVNSVMNGFHPQQACNALVFLSYLLFFPALLGGPVCSFINFQQQVNTCDVRNASQSTWLMTRGCICAFCLQVLRGLVSGGFIFHCTLMDCSQLSCIYIMWTTALLFKLTYYSHWLLDETLFYAAGFVLDCGQGVELRAKFSDTDIWTLETTHSIAVFARTWNKSTAKWLRRLIFQQCKTQPLLMTFAFSAWWHGLHPGQMFGFLCWAVMVEADYRIHLYLNVGQRNWYSRFIYKAFTWVQTQLIIAFIMMAIEMRSFSMVWALCSSYSTLFPLVYCVSMIFLIKRK
ncbi:hypothetical protein FKM82_000938 [Ascaphus truei]